MMWFRRPFRQPVWSQIACGRGLGVLGCGVITLLVLFLAANLIQSARAAEAMDDSAGWRSFEIPRGAKVSRAILRITAVNGFRLLLDGRELGQGTEWRALTEYDLTLLLSAGKH